VGERAVAALRMEVTAERDHAGAFRGIQQPSSCTQRNKQSKYQRAKTSRRVLGMTGASAVCSCAASAGRSPAAVQAVVV
jgi:hypothetical protein